MKLKPVHYGPRGLPKLTLGWQILNWTLHNLLQPDGPDTGEPWVYTDEQARFILWWYAVDERGRFVYRRGMLRRMKGWGKDPVGASICCIEFVGPCRFAGWRDKRTGRTYKRLAPQTVLAHLSRVEPIAEMHPAAWVQTAAVTKDQTRNTMTLFPGMLSKPTIAAHGIDLGKEIIYAHGGKARIEAVTSSPRALEGGRSTFVLKNETHHWLKANDGLAMSDVIARNVAKSRDGSSRVLSISNAHSPGEASDARYDWESRETHDFLYDSLEAPEIDLGNLRQVKQAVLCARGDSEWLDVERLMSEITDPRADPSLVKRYYLNQISYGEDRAFNGDRWDELAEPGHRVLRHALITLGFDGSKTRDHTVLIATEVSSGYQWVAGYWVPEFNPETNEWSVNEREVDETVSFLFDYYEVWRMNIDPFYWGEWVSIWAGRYNRPGKDVVVVYNTTLTRRMAVALLNYKTAMLGGDLTHDGDKRFATAIRNSQKRMQSFADDNGELMWVIEKERKDSPLKIDAAMAGCLSWDARDAALAANAQTTEEEWHGILV